MERTDAPQADDPVTQDPVARATIARATELIDLGELDRADVVLAELAAVAERSGDRVSRAHVGWSSARIAASRGDALRTERLLREVERDGTDWLATDGGLSFLTDAASLLDRVGLTGEARTYVARALQRPDAGPNEERVLRARAALAARSGDPLEGLDLLAAGAGAGPLEQRLRWRQTMLAAWATFRAGRDGAGALAARALEEAVACGGVDVARAGEPALLGALAPLAEAAGSAHARALLLSGRRLIVRLFGATRVTNAGGETLQLPTGMPGELVRMLALHEHGLPVDLILETFFPDTSPSAGRGRLRQLLARLRTASADVVVRDGEVLRLLPAWVDVRAFLICAQSARSSPGPRSVRSAHAALALHTGPLLPADAGAGWAEETRTQVEYRRLAMHDLIAADETGRAADTPPAAGVRARLRR